MNWYLNTIKCDLTRNFAVGHVVSGREHRGSKSELYGGGTGKVIINNLKKKSLHSITCRPEHDPVQLSCTSSFQKISWRQVQHNIRNHTTYSLQSKRLQDHHAKRSFWHYSGYFEFHCFKHLFKDSQGANKSIFAP